MIDETIEIPSEGEVDIQLDTLQEMDLRWRMPTGLPNRLDNRQLESQDIIWFNDVVEEATDLVPTELGNKETMYIVDCTSRSIQGSEMKSYDEFVNGEEDDGSFLGNGSLGVKND